jgi:hypothetical protein
LWILILMVMDQDEDCDAAQVETPLTADAYKDLVA